jgi:preprotein translocase subunit SecA
VDDLREGIGLRGYGQRDPLVEYKNEAFSMFERLMAALDSEIVHRIYKVNVQLAPNQAASEPLAYKPVASGEAPKLETKLSQAAKKMRTNAENSTPQPVVNPKKELGRNDPCWCGSGKKWKKCHYPKTS